MQNQLNSSAQLVGSLMCLTIWAGLLVILWLNWRQQTERKLRRQIRQLQSRLAVRSAAD